MTNKTAAIVAYITIIGWIIALVTYNNQPEAEKSSLLRFHLKQSLGILICSFLIYLISYILMISMPGLWFIGSLLWLGLFVLWIIGIINAAGENEKPLPLLGEAFDKNLTFIK